jgi:putative hemolysin
MLPNIFQRGIVVYLFLLILQLLFILLNAVFSCAETAVISMNDNKLSKLAVSGNRQALRLKKLTEQPSSFLATIQAGITLVNLLSSAVAANNFAGVLSSFFQRLGLSTGASDVIAVSALTVLLTYLTVLFGELIPKRIAMRNAAKIALSLSGLVYFLSKVFIPFDWLFTASANGLFRLFGVDPHSKTEEEPEEEIRMMLDVGKANGTILPEAQDMIRNIFEFDEIFAEEIMTHRTEVFMLWLEESDEDWEKAIIENRHSEFPICGEDLDDIIGILHVKDYFRLSDRSRESVMKNAVSAPYFVPETVRADFLFRNMKKTRCHFAVVVDEYGGLSGIITMSDLLEQLVGDLENDASIPEDIPAIQKTDKNKWIIQGTAALDDVSEQLQVTLPVEDYDTFGGMVFGLLGTVPQDGSTPAIEGFGLHVSITDIKERRLESAVVTLQALDKATE